MNHPDASKFHRITITSPQPKQNITILHLSPELLELIFIYTNDPIPLSQTCRDFHSIIKSTNTRIKWMLFNAPYFLPITNVGQNPRLHLLYDNRAYTSGLAFAYALHSLPLCLFDDKVLLELLKISPHHSDLMLGRDFLDISDSSVNILLRWCASMGFIESITYIASHYHYHLSPHTIGVALCFAISCIQDEITDFLLQLNPDVSVNNSDSLRYAIIRPHMYSSTNKVEYLPYRMTELHVKSLVLLQKLLNHISDNKLSVLKQCINWAIHSPSPVLEYLFQQTNIHPQELSAPKWDSLPADTFRHVLTTLLDGRFITVQDQFIRYDLMEVVIEHDYDEILELLVSRYGFHFRFDNDWCLKFGCMNNAVKVVRMLLRLGADPRVDGDVCLREASVHGRLEILKLLLGIGIIRSEPNLDFVVDSNSGHRPGLITSASSSSLNERNNNLLIPMNVDPPTELVPISPHSLSEISSSAASNWRVYPQQSLDFALLAAVDRGHHQLISLLLACGADFEVNGNQPLRIAIQHNDLWTINLLIRRGANVASVFGVSNSAMDAIISASHS